MTNTKKAQDKLDDFKKDFAKLLIKHPNISVYGDVNGLPFATLNDFYVKPPTISLPVRSH
jgi:hypothetical protein